MAASPSWPTVRLTLRADLAEQYRCWCSTVGSDPADMLELLILAADSADVARSRLAHRILSRISHGEAKPVYDVELPNEADVAVVRMGPPVSETADRAFPIIRAHRGIDITADAATAWAAGRGYWTLARRVPFPEYLAVSRLGLVLHVYRVAEWESVPTQPERQWASRGWLIDAAEGRLVAVDEQAAQREIPPVTEQDLTVSRRLTGALITYPPEKSGTAVLRLNRSSAAQRRYQASWRAARSARLAASE